MQDSTNDAAGVQLNKYISASGLCSRRQADKYIAEYRVTINNETVMLGARVQVGDVVAVDGEKIKIKTQTNTYIAFNKPVGVTSTTDTQDKTNIIDFINHPKRIFPIGRLDKDSEGLILLTNDGDIVNKILRAGNNHEKEYLVTVDKALAFDFTTKMSGGIYILDEKTAPCKVQLLGNKKFKIILTQGLNRQIRRMCEELGFRVMTLKRVRIMNIELNNLPVGKWRNLSGVEIDQINNQVETSVKTEKKLTAIKPKKANKIVDLKKLEAEAKAAEKAERERAAAAKKEKFKTRFKRDAKSGGGKAKPQNPLSKRAVAPRKKK